MPAYDVCYCTRTEVKRALDIKLSTRNNPMVDRAIQTASRHIEAVMLRKFYPVTDTRYFDWPNYQYAAPWKIWLKENELAAWPPTSILAGTTPIQTSQAFPYPWQASIGPPYTAIELDRSTSAAFGGNASTPQRSIVITGPFGYDLNKDQVATLATAITSTTQNPIVVSDSSQLDAGAIIILGSEYCRVTDSAMSATGATLSGSGCTTASSNDNLLTVTGGTLALFETIQLGNERMLIIDQIPGGPYIVKRGWDGFLLTTHSASDPVYAARTLTVVRGDLGSAAGASYGQGSPVYRHRVPSPIRDLAIGASVVQATGEPQAWEKQETVGQTVNASTMAARSTFPGEGLNWMWETTANLYRRKVRIAAI